MAAIQVRTAKSNGPRYAWGAGLVAAGLGIAIVAMVILTGPRGQQQPVDDGTTADAAGAHDVAGFTSYQEAIADMAAAMDQHDWKSVARFSARIEASLTPQTVQAIYAERQQLLANLSAAKSRHDARMVSAVMRQLAALCPPLRTPSTPSFCD